MEKVVKEADKMDTGTETTRDLTASTAGTTAGPVVPDTTVAPRIGGPPIAPVGTNPGTPTRGLVQARRIYPRSDRILLPLALPRLQPFSPPALRPFRFLTLFLPSWRPMLRYSMNDSKS